MFLSSWLLLCQQWSFSLAPSLIDEAASKQKCLESFVRVCCQKHFSWQLEVAEYPQPIKKPSPSSVKCLISTTASLSISHTVIFCDMEPEATVVYVEKKNSLSSTFDMQGQVCLWLHMQRTIQICKKNMSFCLYFWDLQLWKTQNLYIYLTIVCCCVSLLILKSCRLFKCWQWLVNIWV